MNHHTCIYSQEKTVNSDVNESLKELDDSLCLDDGRSSMNSDQSEAELLHVGSTTEGSIPHIPPTDQLDIASITSSNTEEYDSKPSSPHTTVKKIAPFFGKKNAKKVRNPVKLKTAQISEDGVDCSAADTLDVKENTDLNGKEICDSQSCVKEKATVYKQKKIENFANRKLLLKKRHENKSKNKPGEKSQEKKGVTKERGKLAKEERQLLLDSKKAKRELKRMKDKNSNKMTNMEYSESKTKKQENGKLKKSNEIAVISRMDESLIQCKATESSSDDTTRTHGVHVVPGAGSSMSEIVQLNFVEDVEHQTNEYDNNSTTITERNDTSGTAVNNMPAIPPRADSQQSIATSSKSTCSLGEDGSEDSSAIEDTCLLKKEQKAKTSKKSRKSSSTARRSKKSSLSSSPLVSSVWVQCDHSNCLKWRLLQHVDDPTQLPSKWYCSMNKDPKYNSCAADQERWSDLDDSLEFIYSSYSLGSLVWAKLDGYPWWPAMIDNDPDQESYYKLSSSSSVPIRYHVVFFDKPVSRGWIHALNLQPLTADSKLSEFDTVPAKYRHSLSVALDEALSVLSYSASERIKTHGFNILHKKGTKRASSMKTTTKKRKSTD